MVNHARWCQRSSSSALILVVLLTSSAAYVRRLLAVVAPTWRFTYQATEKKKLGHQTFAAG